MKVKRIWMIIALLLIGYSGGIITGVVVDVDQVYHTTIKNIKQKRSPDGTIVLDVDTTTGQQKSRKQLRQEKKQQRQSDREAKKAARKNRKN